VSTTNQKETTTMTTMSDMQAKLESAGWEMDEDGDFRSPGGNSVILTNDSDRVCCADLDAGMGRVASLDEAIGWALENVELTGQLVRIR
jgi:hypothetical protein